MQFSEGGMGNTSQLDYDAVQQAYQEVHDKEDTAKSLIPFANQGGRATTLSANQSEDFTEETDETSRQRGTIFFLILYSCVKFLVIDIIVIN